MPEGEPLRIEGAVTLADRITRRPNCQTATAAEHPTFRGLMNMGLGDIDPTMVVERSFGIVEIVDLTTQRLIQVSYMPEQAHRLVSDYTDGTAQAALMVQLWTSRGYSAFGRSHARQMTLVQFDFLSDLGISVEVGATLPFDQQLEAATRTTWLEFGLQLSYAADDIGATYGFGLAGDMPQKVTAKLRQLLV